MGLLIKRYVYFSIYYNLYCYIFLRILRKQTNRNNFMPRPFGFNEERINCEVNAEILFVDSVKQVLCPGTQHQVLKWPDQKTGCQDAGWLILITLTVCSIK